MMRKTVKYWLITATFLVLLGMGMLVPTACSLNEEFKGKYETNTYEIEADFRNISIKTDTSDILLAPSNDEKCKVVCDEEKNKKYMVSVVDNELIVNVVDTRKWHEKIFGFGEPKMTVYLPESEYTSLIIEESTGDIEIPNTFTFEKIDVSVSTGDVACYASATKTLEIEASTGDIRVENISVGELDISVSTGDVTVSNVTCAGEIQVGVSTGKTYLTNIACKNVISSGSTGDITMNNVIATGKFFIERSTGDVQFDGCDAEEIFVETDTGDVEGSLLSEKVFIVNTDTGKKVVPNTVTGGRCEITTDTGDIQITIQK